MRYFIIGYKCCGKSTMGRQLAKSLNLEFIDLDEVIEQRVGKTIPEYYSEVGDATFREEERLALHSVLKKDQVVISLGGGAPCHFDNMELMVKAGQVIYIELDNETLVNRLASVAKDRPIVKNKTREELFRYMEDKRSACEHFYLKAHHIIDGRGLTLQRMLRDLGL